MNARTDNGSERGREAGGGADHRGLAGELPSRELAASEKAPDRGLRDHRLYVFYIRSVVAYHHEDVCCARTHACVGGWLCLKKQKLTHTQADGPREQRGYPTSALTGGHTRGYK